MLHGFFNISCLTASAFAWTLSSATFATEPEKFTVVAIGDSITMAFNAEQAFKDNADVSWATGKANISGFESHFRKLQMLFPKTTINGYNYAVSGAAAKDLTGQVAKAMAVHPDYVTLMIGANDVCEWSNAFQKPLTDFSQVVKKSLDAIVHCNPKVKITVTSIPDIYRLWDIAKDNATCQMVWDKSHLCAPVLAKNASQADRKAFRNRWVIANQELEKIAFEFPKNIKFSDSPATYKFAKEDVSPNDCFHPSVKGQNTLAQETWKQGWFGTRSGKSL